MSALPNVVFAFALHTIGYRAVPSDEEALERFAALFGDPSPDAPVDKLLRRLCAKSSPAACIRTLEAAPGCSLNVYTFKFGETLDTRVLQCTLQSKTEREPGERMDDENGMHAGTDGKHDEAAKGAEGGADADDRTGGYGEEHTFTTSICDRYQAFSSTPAHSLLPKLLVEFAQNGMDDPMYENKYVQSYEKRKHVRDDSQGLPLPTFF